jgi:hypothetical protein
MCLKVNGVLSIKKWSEKMDRLEHPVILKKTIGINSLYLPGNCFVYAAIVPAAICIELGTRR